MTASFEAALRAGAVAAGLPLEERVIQGCRRHFDLLLRWNKVHNLTRVTAPEEAARKHYLDSLIGLAALRPGSRTLDAGAGAGFPGLLAALAWPDAQLELVEPAQKKASFLQQAKEAMGLQNATILPKGIETASPGDLVLTRATFPWAKLGFVRSAVAPGGTLAAWVGREPDDAAWRALVTSWGWTGRRVELAVPGMEHRGLALANRP